VWVSRKNSKIQHLTEQFYEVAPHYTSVEREATDEKTAFCAQARYRAGDRCIIAFARAVRMLHGGVGGPGERRRANTALDKRVAGGRAMK